MNPTSEATMFPLRPDSIALFALGRFSEWLTTKPEVVRAYFFGSRLKGTFRDDSDIDIILEIDAPPGQSASSFWFGKHEKWHHEAQRLTGLDVHLDLHEPQKPDSNVAKGLHERSLLFYERRPDANEPKH